MTLRKICPEICPGIFKVNLVEVVEIFEPVTFLEKLLADLADAQENIVPGAPQHVPGHHKKMRYIACSCNCVTLRCAVFPGTVVTAGDPGHARDSGRGSAGPQAR